MKPTPDTITRILQQHRSVAIVGLSPKPERDSFRVAQYLQAQGWRIVPINPAAGVATILGEPVYPSLRAAKDAGAPVALVDVFRNSAEVPPIVDEAIACGAQALWLQLGVVHDSATQQAQAAGLAVVQDRCIKVEHARLTAQGVL